MKDNIDYNEKIKFDTLFEKWWDQNGIFKTLHQMNPTRLQYILDRSNGLYKKKVLDVGCGGGILSESMAKQGAIVTGLDIGKNIIKIAKKHAFQNKLKINYLCNTIEEYSYNTCKKKNKLKYDVITCMELLEHIPNPLSVIKTSSFLLKNGGNVFFSTLNRTFKSWLFLIVGAEYVLNLLPKGTHEFKKFIKPSELLAWLDKTQLQEQNIQGLSYNIIYKQFTLSNDINVNYILHATKYA